MATTLEKIQKRPVRNYFVKVLIQDTANKWVDISERVKRHKDRVTGIPKIKINTDSKTLSYRFFASSGNLVVDNSDGFWDGHVDFTLRTVDGAVAVFNRSKSYSEVVWSGRKIQFRLIEFFGETYKEKALGTFIINDIETSLGDTATLNLVDLSEPLRSRDASVVKNGMSWYQNRSISFLVKKLLELEYGTETGGLLPATYDIDSRIDLETYDGSSTISVIGPPPQLTDTDGDGIADIYLEKQKRTRAMVIAPAIIGAANKSDAKNTLYLGSDKELYSYNTTEDIFTKLGEVPSYYTNRYIHKLFYDDTQGIIYAVVCDALERGQGGAGYSRNIDGLIDLIQNYTSGDVYEAIIYSYTSIEGFKLIDYTEFSTGRKFGSSNGKFIGRLPIRIDGHGSYIGQHYTYNAGPNIYTPYRQYFYSKWPNYGIETVAIWWDVQIVDLGPEVSFLEKADSAFQSGGPLVKMPTYGDGYLFIYSGEVIDFMGYRYSIGSQGNICFNKVVASGFNKGAFCGYTVGADDSLQFVTFNPDTGGQTFLISSDLNISISGTSCSAQPICSCADGIVAKIYSGVVAFRDKIQGASYNDYEGQIWAINYSTGTKTNLISSTKPYIPVELFYNPYDSTHKLWVVYMCQEYLLTDGTNKPIYKICRINTTTGAQLDVNNLTNLTNQPTGFTQDSAGNLYFVTHQAGLLYKYSTTGVLELLDSGFPITEESSFLSAGLCIDTATRSGSTIIWGVSAGEIDNEMMESTTPAGKSYLFKYDKVISEHVELADFSGLSVWDALGLLAQRAHCSMGFDEEGNFFFKRREIDSTVSYTIDIDKGDAISIEKDRGKEDIYNYVDIAPYIVTFKEPEYKGYLNTTGRSDKEKEATVGDDEVVIKQTDLVTKKIDMVCIRDGNMNKSIPLFKYIVYEPVITGRFIADQSNATVLNVGSTFGGEETEFGIKVGYCLLYTDTDENEFYRRITAISSDTNTITLDSAISVKMNDEFSVYRRYKVSSSDISTKAWSDEGVTYIATGVNLSTIHTVNSVENLSVGTLINIGGSDVRIVAISEDDKKISVSQEVTTTTGEIVKAYFAPASANTWYEIGNTNVQLMISTTAVQTVFKQGDRITIDCAGLGTEADEASRQIAVNNESISKHGKNQYPNINNRFLTRKLAKQLAQKLRTLYAFPKYSFKITIPLSNYLDIKGTSNLARIDIRSQKLLPLREGYTESCRIVSMEHDTMKGTTTIELKADVFY